uniref:Uncharacterized protein n=1 Tax=Chromera velia CCMP2878 TaxID=1169474 RepID=A0A0G4F094_9ALVE|eukprot:Cvel_14475.t1-p1 / transcript=Cvel_14475.t1 / gene=Cvel_14475 / organism=Chromera_velia_CCMP2878 / gene_product=hypothetical protein / transcript_product=hypothetical protein / location=Cvel_scaffold1031:13249-14236(+) / protein_length=196 / sequence_SO=supercontig / SO=protein_coding / is_pseudo=false
MEMGAADVTAAFLMLKDHNQERVSTTLPKVLPEYPKESPFPDVPQERYEELMKEARKFEAGETYLIEMGLYGLPCATQLFDAKLEGVCKKLGFWRVDTAIRVIVTGKKGEPTIASLTKPSKRIFKTVVRVLEVMKANPDKRIFRGIRGNPVVHAYFDAAFVLATYGARLEYAIRVLDSCFLPACDEKEALFLNWIA